jgi:hypothetical protein
MLKTANTKTVACDAIHGDKASLQYDLRSLHAYRPESRNMPHSTTNAAATRQHCKEATCDHVGHTHVFLCTSILLLRAESLCTGQPTYMGAPVRKTQTSGGPPAVTDGPS